MSLDREEANFGKPIHWHYDAAQKHLDAAEQYLESTDPEHPDAEDRFWMSYYLRMAQVHATLATVIPPE